MKNILLSTPLLADGQLIPAGEVVELEDTQVDELVASGSGQAYEVVEKAEVEEETKTTTVTPAKKAAATKTKVEG
jgi:hypothetical protein